MTTILDALVTQITNKYGDSGGGGAAPAYIKNYNEILTTPAYPSSDENIMIWRDRPAHRVPFNENYTNITHRVNVLVSTPTSDDRLKEIVDELIIVINNYALTGVHVQYVEDVLDRTDRRDPVFVMQLVAIMIENMVDSPTSYAGSASAPHMHDGDTLELDGINSDGGAFPFTTTGPVTFNQDIIAQSDIEITGELIFPSATIHSSGSDIHIHPNTGNTIGNLYLHPVGTEDQSCLHLRTSVSANYGQFSVDIDGVIASFQSSQGGTGTAPSTLNMNDADWDNINIGDGSAIVTLGSLVMLDGGASIDIIRDEDNMSSDDANALATQQSIKAFVPDHTLDDFNEVAFDGPANKDLLMYDGPGSTWDDVSIATMLGDGDLNDLGTKNHNDLDNIDAADIKHITAAQLGALHATYTNAEAVAAVEAAGLAIATTKLLAFNDGGSADIIRDEDNMVSDDVNALCTQQSIKKYVDDNAGGPHALATHTDVAATGPQLEDMLMFGSANAAYVPCILGMPTDTTWYWVDDGTGVTNTDNSGGSTNWMLPMPPVKGGLKLYIAKTKLVLIDADAQAFVNRVMTRSRDSTGVQTYDDDNTNRTAPGDYVYDYVDADMSARDQVWVYVNGSVNAAWELSIAAVMVECYYAA